MRVSLPEKRRKNRVVVVVVVVAVSVRRMTSSTEAERLLVRDGGDDGDERHGRDVAARQGWRGRAIAMLLAIGVGVLATTTWTADGGHASALGAGLSSIRDIEHDSRASAMGDWQSAPRDWHIVGFASETYEDVAKLWYYRLQNLGYEYHHIVAVDDEIYAKLTRAGLRVIRAPDFTMVPGADLGSFWNFRLRYLLGELKRGQNVLLSDLDVIFAHHYDPNVLFNEVNDEEVDVFHSLGTAWPKEAHDKWGFSLCMGFAAFKATPATKALLEAAVQVCDKQGDDCDDQTIMNDLYLNYLQISWKPTEKHDQRKGVSHNSLIPITVKTLANLVPRLDVSKLVSSSSKLDPMLCYGHVHHVDGGNWAVAPIVEKVGASKVEIWKRFHDECLVSATANDAL